MKFPLSVPWKLSERKGHQSRHQIKQLPAEAGDLIPSIWRGNTLNYVFMHVIVGLYLVSLSSTMIPTYFNIMSKHFWVYKSRSSPLPSPNHLLCSSGFICAGAAPRECSVRGLWSQNPQELAPKSFKLSWKRVWREEWGSVGADSCYSLPKWVSLHNQKSPFESSQGLLAPPGDLVGVNDGPRVAFW